MKSTFTKAFKPIFIEEIQLKFILRCEIVFNPDQTD